MPDASKLNSVTSLTIPNSVIAPASPSWKVSCWVYVLLNCSLSCQDASE